MTWREVQISGILDRERKCGSLPSHQKPSKQVKTMADADCDISGPFSSIVALTLVLLVKTRLAAVASKAMISRIGR